MTHPFHPLYGRDFEFVAHRHNWGEDRVHLHDENGSCSRCQLDGPMCGGGPVRGDYGRPVPVTADGLLAAADLVALLRAERTATGL